MSKVDSALNYTGMMMMMTKNKNISLVTEQDIEAALQLIRLRNHHLNSSATTKSGEHLRSKIHEPFTNIVLKAKEFLKSRDIKQNKKIICSGGDENIKKRKRDGIASCSSSITFDLDDNSDDEDVKEAVGNSVKKMRKFRSIVDIYNVTKPL